MAQQHDDYDQEVVERMELMCVEDMPPLTERECARIESAYRRGYQQGWSRAVDALNDGATFSAMDDFCGNDLYRWRFSKHGGRLELPPELYMGRCGPVIKEKKQ